MHAYRTFNNTYIPSLEPDYVTAQPHLRGHVKVRADVPFPLLLDLKGQLISSLYRRLLTRAAAVCVSAADELGSDTASGNDRYC